MRTADFLLYMHFDNQTEGARERKSTKHGEAIGYVIGDDSDGDRSHGRGITPVARTSPSMIGLNWPWFDSFLYICVVYLLDNLACRLAGRKYQQQYSHRMHRVTGCLEGRIK